jgi:hypothetical protein
VLQFDAGVFMAGSRDELKMADPTCKHKRTQLIAKDDESQYVECLDCGEVFEVGELKAGENKDRQGFDESLSDA